MTSIPNTQCPKNRTMGVMDDKTPITMKVGSETLTEAHSFKNLGTRFNAEATCVEEVKNEAGSRKSQVGQPGHTVEKQNIDQ